MSGGADIERVTVECPECGKRRETDAAGDIAACGSCDARFGRYQNIVVDDTEEAR